MTFIFPAESDICYDDLVANAASLWVKSVSAQD